jgi:hypothetical protein
MVEQMLGRVGKQRLKRVRKMQKDEERGRGRGEGHRVPNNSILCPSGSQQGYD